MSFALLLFLNLSCSTISEKYPRHPLLNEVLKPRLGHTGLTNRACEAWDDKGNCTAYIVKDYNLKDPQVRDTVRKLDFVCRIGGHRYKICADKAGFCRTTYEKKCQLGVFCKNIKHEEFVDVQNYQFLIDAKTACFSRQTYSWTEIK